MQMEIRFEKNVAFLTGRMFASAMIRVFRKFGALRRVHVRHHRRQWAGPSCVSLMAPLHNNINRAKPKLSRHLLIDNSRCRLSHRLRAVLCCLCRGAIRDTHESPAHCLRHVGHDSAEYSKRGQDTGLSRMPAIRHGKKCATFCFKPNLPPCCLF